MAEAERGFGDGQDLLELVAGGGQAPDVLKHDTQSAPPNADVGVVGAERGFGDGQGLLEQLAGGGLHAG